MNVKDFIRGAFVFMSMISVLASFLIVNGLFWGGAF
jgi:hypothetical protein